MEDYKPNSNLSKRKDRSETTDIFEKKVEKIEGIGNVKVRKKSGFGKFLKSFVRDDAENVGSYLIGDILIPSLQKAVVEMVSNGIEIVMYGSSSRKKHRSPGSYYSYNSIWDDRRDRDRDRDYDRDRRRSIDYDLDEIIFESRDDAEEVLIRMDEIRDRYDGIVTVLDLFDLVGRPARHTDNKYGWTSLKSAGVSRVRDGYVLRLPRPMPID